MELKPEHQAIVDLAYDGSAEGYFIMHLAAVIQEVWESPGGQTHAKWLLDRVGSSPLSAPTLSEDQRSRLHTFQKFLVASVHHMQTRPNEPMTKH
ncbi:MAG: hypothetical protein OXC19_07035 [Bryobacterales bacterium]|nr:hypothetical protein [Bryobacterales bacterium]